ncbi:MAG: permease-like cell division protein FtsX [Ignavibacteriales bacterium]|nr:MAG: hypothetical protein F9K26_07355 [Ignavibacteriaceae bacterium]MBW7872926.1 hypothetical protein [Ignavibacteria bacterium]MCZ2142445.1 permease-like cell division protein FtsX [Ignavibacteriales bacterium]OQY72948.1 MAG: hypothetical protein B6D45_08540 [Ignavibacteriales bacterium UTCHB3]MBV6445327.1 hypothetical protein [Ignavibacteriaceae bacterium]
MFYIKEAWRNLKFAGITSIITFFSLLLASGFTVSSYLISNFTDEVSIELQKNVTATFYLEDSLSSSVKDYLISEIQKEDAVKNIKYISKETAEMEFISQTGEDFRKILAANPLPASLLVTLDPNKMELQQLEKVVKKISELSGISEYEFRSKMLEDVINFAGKVRTTTIIITALFLFLSLYLAYTSIRFAFEARREDLNTMRLVGGTLLKIKAPAYLSSFILGILCAIITFLIYSIVVNLKIEFLEIQINKITGTWGTILVLGAAPFIALLGTFFASFSMKIQLKGR